ncbi:MAG TPA: UDP-3-O-(3-hydroxymyristoyl)glucosamine N-acyltransferase [Tepidisphaeraceae bacterium]|nr:UDP-3-O-(3-hydroxymyristoyl)glucosamine N-acyltransferase [Tepidisphaeraceae bacterium]
MSLTLKELASEIEAELVGDPDLIINSCSTLEDAGPGQVSFLANPKYFKQLESTRASAIVVSTGVRGGANVALLKTKDPYYAFTRAVVRLHGYRKHTLQGIHPDTHIDSTATVGPRTIIYPGVYIGPRTRVGSDCIIHPNVVIYEDCVIGDRVILNACACIGQDGFGFATHKGIQHKIPQIGRVVIEDDVEVGACTTIDRGALADTVIGKGSKLSNLIAFGHGSTLGEHSLIVGQVGIAGSVKIGHHVTLAGQVGVAGHLKIGNNVTVAAQSGIMEDLPDQGIYIGAPAMPALQARRVYSIFTQLPELMSRIKELEQKVEELSAEDGAGEEEPRQPGETSG